MPLSSLITRFVASTNNKTRCPIFCVRFAPDGRRVLTGDNSGGISVWNTQDFNYQQYLQVCCVGLSGPWFASWHSSCVWTNKLNSQQDHSVVICCVCCALQSHNKAVRDIQFMHNGQFVLAADDTGAVKLSTANLKPLTDMKVHQLVGFALPKHHTPAAGCMHVSKEWSTRPVHVFLQRPESAVIRHYHPACVVCIACALSAWCAALKQSCTVLATRLCGDA